MSMARPRHRALLTVALTLTAVLAPSWLLLPLLHDRAVMAWHVNAFAGGEPHALGLGVLLLGIYVAVLLIRYAAFVVASAVTLPESAEMKAKVEPTPAGRGWPMISVLVPAYNEGLVIRQALASLTQLDYPCLEILVIDDGSSDDTWQQAQQTALQDRRVRVLRKRNGGKASALNLGLASARGSLVLCVDADSRLNPAAVRYCVRHFDDPTVAAVAGNIKVVNRENAVTRLQALEYIQGLALERRAQGAIGAVSVIGGPLGLFRKAALMAVGGYDHDTFAEDRDVTVKLLARGWRVLYEPLAVAHAESPSRWLDLLSQRYRWTRGTVQVVLKHRRHLWHWRERPTVGISLWYMAIDSIVVPVVSLASLAYFGFLALYFGATELLLLWWVQVAFFDVAVTAYSLSIDEEDARLLPWSLLQRFYAVFTDVAKVLATVEELLKLEMSWGKLVREGKI
jgi:poly-beta-1,6-N-acetyl-D-glucosamine synthase